mmetsp:Transcript_7565/g.11546  ORF Transcript_7565/g.11546 Transcript_7565/m.11546 type:complete len:392 (-) Transcript_7565:52-1227(-)
MESSPASHSTKMKGTTVVVDPSVSNNSTGSSTSTPEPSAPPMQDARKMFSESVKGIQALAINSYDGLKEWASSPRRWSPARQGEKSCEKNASHSPIENESPEAARDALFQDLMSPFMACHVGRCDKNKDEVEINERSNSASNGEEKMNHMEELQKLKDRIFLFAESDGGTVISLDNSAAEDEKMQIQRLTSWNTTESLDNLSAAMSLSMTGSMTEADTSTIQFTDDDGHVIPPEIVEQVQKRRREKRRRQRVVRFDYPPIKSLRECPRHNPDDLPDLFFTEEELDEIEADRTSTVTADDIEIVAVGNVGSSSSSSPGSPKKSESQKSPPSSPTTPPPLKRKPRSSSPHPSRPAKGSYNKNQSEDSKSPQDDPRLIKGVQIYLRERSTGRGR